MSENAAPVSPAPDASHFSTAELLAALRALPYREAAFLLTRLTQGRSLEQSAAFYGISPESFSVHFLRAALGVTRAASLPCRPPENDAEEDVWARALTGALEQDTVGVPPALTETLALCRRMRALGQEVTGALQAAEREEENSPTRRREDLMRRLAVMALLGLTAWLYCNRPMEEPPKRSIPPPSHQR
ncbi:hypothetical protein [Cystobacter ferrugineus]|uniref:Uncharacterized protein n=1 Tax=Cystobacter ferrugineus TaxID=83449 RepID=A0A1L9AUY5_9BACT|nr:hypothetical protein [Cystobacter ferrugineus]OJH33802.1 hypothetical protein BON30_46645 [Cystobacter ferrugineus]